MSNCWLNIRFGSYHLQLLRDRPYIRWGINAYHEAARNTDKDWKWFEWY
jgi:hypothetical protein